MKLYRGLHNTPRLANGCVASIGNFDGVHLGHQAMLSQLKAQSLALNLPAVVIVFEPQPLEYFQGNKAPARLSRLRDKMALFSQCQIDIVVCLSFNAYLANLSPEQFASQVLFKHLNVHYLMVGEDFRFGKDRGGDFELLDRLCQHNNCQLAAMPTVSSEQGKRISSTAIRHALMTGDLVSANALLGRNFSIYGRVAHGDKRAREWGIPTANVFLRRMSAPLQGVYCVTATIDDNVHAGVANIGTRPTVDGTKSLLEVHLFDFEQEIYGRLIAVEFKHKLRNEQRFDSIELLKQQILDDARQARAYFEQQAMATETEIPSETHSS